MRGKQIAWSGRLRLCYESVTERRPQNWCCMSVSMARMTSYPTLDWKDKTRKSKIIDLFTISSKTSTLTDDNVVVLAVQVDEKIGDTASRRRVSDLVRETLPAPSRNPLRSVITLKSAQVEQTKNG
jgi:hypothetical protein